MILIKDKANCTGCHACYSICPTNSIKMHKDKEGFLYPVINKNKCIDCNLCDKVCPVNNEKYKTSIVPKAYGVQNLNNEILIESSSGGIFTILAEYVLNKQGVVFGACFNQNFYVEHREINARKDLYKLRGSKYVQSTIGDTYYYVKKRLQEGKIVLFSGTPCQVAGLNEFLKKKYENLISLDIICHGVPSPSVWKRYIDYREKTAGAKINDINFRNKLNGWKKFSVMFNFQNKSQYFQEYSSDLYMKIFLSNYILRPSCYKCNFKSFGRNCDFTLGDFWGIQNILPELDNNRGTSLVFLHTSKACNIFNNISNQIIYKEVDGEKVIQFNKAMIKSVECPNNRQKFMDNILKKPFDQVVNNFCKLTINKIVKKIYKKLFNYIKNRKFFVK